MGFEEFDARVQIIGINPYVRVPAAIVKALLRRYGREKGPVPVRGELDGKPFKQTVVKYRSLWRLYLNNEMRRLADVDVGDMVQVRMELDEATREVPMHPILAQALSRNGDAGKAFRKLPPSRQKEILRYLHSLKSAEALERNVQKVMQTLGS